MGICISSHANDSVCTANLILMDGSIREFSQVAKCREILQEYSGYFICSSDGLYVGRNISEVLQEDDQLQVGQLYFLLPQRKLEYVMTESDMAALLFKASSAIKQKRRSSKKVQPLFDVNLDVKEEGLTRQKSSCNISKTPVSAGRRLGRTQWRSKLETIVEIV